MKIKQRSGRNNQIYFAVNGALATSTNVFTANVDISYYYGYPIDNPGLSSYVERAVVNDKAGRFASVRAEQHAQPDGHGERVHFARRRPLQEHHHGRATCRRQWLAEPARERDVFVLEEVL
jgi:hypothetical protein